MNRRLDEETTSVPTSSRMPLYHDDNRSNRTNVYADGIMYDQDLYYGLDRVQDGEVSKRGTTNTVTAATSSSTSQSSTIQQIMTPSSSSYSTIGSPINNPNYYLPPLRNTQRRQQKQHQDEESRNWDTFFFFFGKSASRKTRKIVPMLILIVMIHQIYLIHQDAVHHEEKDSSYSSSSSFSLLSSNYQHGRRELSSVVSLYPTASSSSSNPSLRQTSMETRTTQSVDYVATKERSTAKSVVITTTTPKIATENQHKQKTYFVWKPSSSYEPKQQQQQQQKQPVNTNRRSNSIHQFKILQNNGWNQVDQIKDAKLVIVDDDHGEKDGTTARSSLSPLFFPTESTKNSPLLQPWQVVNTFPSEHIFFRWKSRQLLLDRRTTEVTTTTNQEVTKNNNNNNNKPTSGRSRNTVANEDTADDNGGVCDSLLYNGRPIFIKVFWFIVSLDPFIVLYHDGYMDIPYSELDPYPYMIMTHSKHPTKVNNKDNRSEQLVDINYHERRIWRGSWESLENELRMTLPSKEYAKMAMEGKNPIIHIKNQFKRTLVDVAEAFRGQANYYQERKFSSSSAAASSLPHSFAVYSATFQIDRNFNTFLFDLEREDLMSSSDTNASRYGQVPTPAQTYKTNLHNDLYTSALRILEVVIDASVSPPSQDDTSSRKGGPSAISNVDPLSQAEDLTWKDQEPNSKSSLGQYELLIRGEYWKFDYEWNHKATACNHTMQ